MAKSEGEADPLVPMDAAVAKAENRARRANAALCALLLFNVLAFIARQAHGDAPGSGWAKRAVQEAEAAAMERCSGHGHVFVDTHDVVGPEGRPACECHECFTGPDCSNPTPECVAGVDVGDPLLFEEYWSSNPDLGTVLIPGWYRMSYFTNEAERAFYTDALTASIRELHALAGNAVTEGRYIAVGNGAMQLINAIVHGLALQDITSSYPVSPVVATTPYYSMYYHQTNFLDSRHYEWVGEPSANLAGKGVPIELIASPNNPTAQIQDVPTGFQGHVVYDHAYYWPHLTPITKAADSDIMVFTFSKITGHAGSRIGWAILKDFDLFQKVSNQVFLTTGGVSHEAQLRATQIMGDVIKTYQAGTAQGIFHFGHEVLHSRWARLQGILSKSTRFALQELKPEHCNFFQKISPPSPAYAWIHCTRYEDVDCNQVMRTAGITGRPGAEFGSSNRYVRLTMLKRQSEFENLASNLINLVAQS